MLWLQAFSGFEVLINTLDPVGDPGSLPLCPLEPASRYFLLTYARAAANRFRDGITGCTRFVSRLTGLTSHRQKRSRRDVNREGWDSYARMWDDLKVRGEIPDLRSDRVADVEHLGDEWSLMAADTFSYGVDVRSVTEFGEYLDAHLFAPHLPRRDDLRIMELGPGGGRVTKVLLPRAQAIYAVDISKAMLQRLQARFADETKIVPIVVDGTNIQGIAPGTLDAAVSFDTFVHLEPWEIFRYLEMTHALLRNGGVGIIHFSDVETSIGFGLFRAQVPSVVQQGLHCATFSVMTKGIMQTFLAQLGFEIISISNHALPRDAVAVFRRRDASLPDDRCNDA